MVMLVFLQNDENAGRSRVSGTAGRARGRGDTHPAAINHRPLFRERYQNDDRPLRRTVGVPLKLAGLQRCRINGLILRDGARKCRKQRRRKRTGNEQPTRKTTTIIDHKIQSPTSARSLQPDPYFATVMPRSSRHLLKTTSIAWIIFTWGFALQYTITSCSVSFDLAILM